MLLGPFILTVDIGTGSVRASLFDESGDVHFTSRSGYRTEHPKPGWSEQDPEGVLTAAVHVLREAVAWAEGRGSIAALSFSSQMYSVLAVAPDGSPLSPSLPWMDTRAHPLAVQIAQDFDAMALGRSTGCPVRATYPLAKIGWMLENLDLPNDVMFISIKDYLVHRLVGQMVCDWSTASATGLFDVHELEWSDSAMAVWDLDAANLPSLASPRHNLTIGRGSILHGMGLRAAVVLGAGDAPLSSIGCGATSAHSLTINIGTSAAVRQLVSDPFVDPRAGLWTYVADEGRWVIGGAVGSAGSAFDWVLRTSSLDGTNLSETYREAIDAASTVPAGSDDLLFLPYLTGEQSPDWNEDGRGAFVGITLRHGRGHLVRAALEGIGFALRRVGDAMQDARDDETRELFITGRLGSDPVVRQIIADIFGLPVALAVPEGSSRGAAVLAWIALGRFHDYEEFFDAHIEVAPLAKPDMGRHALYEDRYEAFVRLTRRLSSDRNRSEKTP